MMACNFVCPVSKDKYHAYQISAWRKNGDAYKASELICKHCLRKIPYSSIQGYSEKKSDDAREDS